MKNSLTGQVVRFVSHNGNEFGKDEIAVCLDEDTIKFLGIHGDNFGKVWFESNAFAILGNDSHKITELLAEARSKYHS